MATYTLSEDLSDALENEASKLGISANELVAQIVSSYIEEQEVYYPTPEEEAELDEAEAELDAEIAAGKEVTLEDYRESTKARLRSKY